MKKCYYVLSLLLLTAIFTFTFCTGIKKKKQNNSEKPNIIFILADDLGWADLPVYGNTFNEAPNLDILAKEGIRFTNAYAACPVCSPTRASIMSGQYPARVGIIDFITGHWRPDEKVIVPQNRTQYLPAEIYTIGEAMKDAGYITGYFGKWHLGSKEQHHPSNQGFDVAYEYAGGGYYNPRFRPEIKIDSSKRLSELLTDYGIDFIEKNQNEPFFLFLAHYDVHVQLDADSALIQKYLNKEKFNDYPGNAVYAAMIGHLDNSVGRIIRKLDELELSNNTVVIFFSDNGGLISRFDKMPLLAKSKQPVYNGDTLLYIATSNKPLRAEKGTVFEGGIREPLIVKWPDKIPADTKSDAIVSSVDFFPTLVELAGGTLPEQQVIDGKSIIPELMNDEYNTERAIFWHYPVYHHDVPASAIRKGDWKLIHNLVDNSLQLYNLSNDIGETNNLAELNKKKTNELYQLLEEWRKDTKAELPVENPDFNPEKRYLWGKHPSRVP